jgi:hypothetical protein
MAQHNKPHSFLYQPNKQAWLNHFMAAVDGGASTSNKGFNILKVAAKTASRETPQTVNLVTEAAQGDQIAKSEIRQEEKELKQPTAAPPRTYRRAPPSRRKKVKIIKPQDPDIFHQ